MKQRDKQTIHIKNTTTFSPRSLFNIPNSTAVVFETGEYHFWPEEAQLRRFAISNTDTSTNSEQVIGLLIEGKKQMSFIGNDTVFVFHGCQMAIAIIDCEDFIISGITICYSCPSAVDITVSQVNGSEIIVSYPPPHRAIVEKNTVTWYGEESPLSGKPYWSMQGDMNITQLYTPVDDTVLRVKPAPFSGCRAISDMGDNRLKITYDTPCDIKKGDVYQIRRTLRETCGIFIGTSSRVVFNDMKISYLYAMGIVSQCSEDLTFKRVLFRSVEKARYSASAADFLQFSGCRGNILIDECEFVNPHDDPINIHGTYLEVTKTGKNRARLRYCHPQTRGFRSVFQGDLLELLSPETLLPYTGQYTVLEVTGPEEDSPDIMEVLLDNDIPQYTRIVAENISFIPNVTISGCKFYRCPTRAILLTTRGKAVIENNLFSHIGMAAISISGDANEWFESGAVHDVAIKNNRFENCCQEALLVCPTNTVIVEDKAVHSNISFTCNTLLNMPIPALRLKSVANLLLDNNSCVDCESEELQFERLL